MTCGQVGGFSRGTPVSSTNNGDRHDIAKILLKVALNTIIIILSAVLQLVDCFYGSGNDSSLETNIYWQTLLTNGGGNWGRAMVISATLSNIYLSGYRTPYEHDIFLLLLIFMV